MTPAEVAAAQQSGAVLLDMRLPRVFAKAHVPGAVNLQFNRADLVDRADMALSRDPAYLVHAEPEAIAKVAADLMRDSGFNILGHLEGGLAGWRAAGLPTATITVISVDDLAQAGSSLQAIDARDRFEFKHAHVPGASWLSWTDAWSRAGEAPTGPLAVICGDEVRSSLVASILHRHGRDVRLVVGGMVDWNERGFPVERGQP
jgi:rhodanese-related sulfurtransferase